MMNNSTNNNKNNNENNDNDYDYSDDDNDASVDTIILSFSCHLGSLLLKAWISNHLHSNTWDEIT